MANIDTGEIKNFTLEEIKKLPLQEREKWVPLTESEYALLKDKPRYVVRNFFNSEKKRIGLKWKEFYKKIKALKSDSTKSV